MFARTTPTLLILLFTGMMALPAAAVDLDTLALLDMVEGITVTETSALNFGDVAMSNGTLSVSTAGAVTDPSFLSYDPASVSQGIFTVSAIAGNAYDISLLETVPTAGLILDNFILNIDGGADEAGSDNFVGVTLVNASSVLNIGADLTVDAATASLGDNQTIGYRVTVNFN